MFACRLSSARMRQAHTPLCTILLLLSSLLGCSHAVIRNRTASHVVQGAKGSEEKLPTPFCEPKPYRPFAFFHQRHTIGPWLNEALYNAARDRKYRTGVSCHMAPCQLQTGLRNWNHVVLAGHLTWGYVYSNLPTAIPDILHPTGALPNVSCLTIFSYPMNRIHQCYNTEGMYDWLHADGRPIKLSEMTALQMKQVLSRVRSKDGYGCLNEPIRLFSGLTSEQDISQLHTEPDLARMLVKKAKSHLSKCVILMQEDLYHPRTPSILRHWFPWLNLNLTTHQKARDPRPQPRNLSPEQVMVLHEMAAAEYELYYWAHDRYLKQLQHLRRTSGAACIE